MAFKMSNINGNYGTRLSNPYRNNRLETKTTYNGRTFSKVKSSPHFMTHFFNRIKEFFNSSSNKMLSLNHTNPSPTVIGSITNLFKSLFFIKKDQADPKAIMGSSIQKPNKYDILSSKEQEKLLKDLDKVIKSEGTDLASLKEPLEKMRNYLSGPQFIQLPITLGEGYVIDKYNDVVFIQLQTTYDNDFLNSATPGIQNAIAIDLKGNVFRPLPLSQDEKKSLLKNLKDLIEIKQGNLSLLKDPLVKIQEYLLGPNSKQLPIKFENYIINQRDNIVFIQEKAAYKQDTLTGTGTGSRNTVAIDQKGDLFRSVQDALEKPIS